MQILSGIENERQLILNWIFIEYSRAAVESLRGHGKTNLQTAEAMFLFHQRIS
jgi:hypothetical protein